MIAIPGSDRQFEIAISCFKPTIGTGSYIPRGTLVDGDVGQFAEGYGHTLAAFGGYDKATIRVKDQKERAEDWLQRIGFHIEAYSPEADEMWSGLVNKVTVRAGGRTLAAGPFTAIANSIYAVFSAIDQGTSTVGRRDVTATYTDAASQARFGIVQKVLSAGGMTAAAAAEQAQAFLAENSYPPTTQSGSNVGESVAQVSIGCLGYMHFLRLFEYANAGTGQYTDARDKILAVLGADPNGVISTDYTKIGSNPIASLQVLENKNETGMSVIKQIVSLGDGTDHTRWIFGIYDGRIVVYEKPEAAITYTQQLDDPEQRVNLWGGGDLWPWHVRPGRWLMYTDALPGEQVPTTVAEYSKDVRVEFIEQVDYTAPFQVTHRGGRYDTIPQRLAKLGLAGIGA